MTFPRIAAIAEVGWSAKDARNWDDFAARMIAEYARYSRAGINYAPSAFNVALAPASDPATKAMVVRMETETHDPDIRYTLDGSDPKADSKRYSKPLHMKGTTTVRAGTFENGKLLGKITETRFTAHIAMGRPVTLAFPYKEKYKGGGELGLTDGLRGTISHTDGRWQGFEGDDLAAEIDLGQPTAISRIKTGFLQNVNSWIFFPAPVEFSVSDDGRVYRVVAAFESGVSLQTNDPLLKEFATETRNIKARFIRVQAKNIGVCPPGHPGAGGKAWIFVDEIVVE
jgi:hexosaminidase